MSGFKGQFEDLQQVIESIHVRHIAVYGLEACQPEETLGAVLARMEEYDIDIMPVASGAQPFTAYMMREGIKQLPQTAKVREVKHRPISVSDIVASETPLRQLVSLFQTHTQPWFFVLEGNRVEGIVTQGDLQKPAFRAYLFGLLSVLEVYLLDLIEEAYPNDEWRDLPSLPPKVWDKAEHEYGERKRRGEAPSSYAEVLGLGDKLQILRHSPAWLEPLGIKAAELDLSLSSPKDWLQELYQVRNNIAHADDLVKRIKGRWRHLYWLTERLEALVSKLQGFGPEGGGV